MKYPLMLLTLFTLTAYAEPVEPTCQVDPIEPACAADPLSAECMEASIVPACPTGDNEEDIMQLYRTNNRQDEQIQAIAKDVATLKVQVQQGGTVRSTQSPQPSQSSTPTYQQPQTHQRDNSWYDGHGRKRYPADKGPK